MGTRYKDLHTLLSGFIRCYHANICHSGGKKKKKKKLAVRIQITSTCSFYCYSKAVGTARADCSTESVSRASVVVIMTADGNRK
jgi:hypothetical protein